MRSSKPRAFNSATRLRPMNPPAPVTAMRLLTDFSAAIDFHDLLDGAGGGAPHDHVGQDHSATMSLNNFTAADIVRPVLALDQHLGQDFGDHFLGFLVAEEDDIIHRAQGSEYQGAIFF